MHRTMRNIAVSSMMLALANSLGTMQAKAGVESAGLLAATGGYRNSAHGWAGKRRKLKKSHQDHQRPRRRRI